MEQKRMEQQFSLIQISNKMIHTNSTKDLHLQRQKTNSNTQITPNMNFVVLQSNRHDHTSLNKKNGQVSRKFSHTRHISDNSSTSGSQNQLCFSGVKFRIHPEKYNQSKNQTPLYVRLQPPLHENSQKQNAQSKRTMVNTSSSFTLASKNLNLLQNQPKNEKIYRPSKEEAKRPSILNRKRATSVLFDLKGGKILGKGKFGNVFMAQHIPTNFLVAVKQISLQNLCQKLIQRLTWQIKIQSYLKNENCLDLYRCERWGNSLYLLMELGDCSLFQKLRQKKYFTQVQTCYYISQTIKALIYMHKQGVIHRDIKPENIILANNVVKIADFGWSIYIGKKQSRSTTKRNTFCGTLDYMSPQIILGDSYDQMVDVWSVGVLCYELCTGHAPFQTWQNHEQKYRKIVHVDLKYPKYLSEDIKDFISRLLTRSPQSRMSLQQALSHRWIKKYYTY